MNAAAIVFALFAASVCGLRIEHINSISIEKPAFVTTFPAQGSSANGTTAFPSLDLVVSSFGIGIFRSLDQVRFIRDIGSSLRSRTQAIHTVGDSLIWPNEISLIDDDRVVVAGGFLVPGKTGKISEMSLSDFYQSATPGSDKRWRTLLKDKSNGFYHRVVEFQVKGKNNRESRRLLSCRGYKNVFSASGGEMVYLEPSENGTFKSVEIYPGCDCFFEPVDLNGDGIEEFIIPQFFGEKLVLMWTEDPNGDYTKRDLIRTRVIDDGIGMVFDVQVTDLDRNGIPDILVTNHQKGSSPPFPALVSYEARRGTRTQGQIVLENRVSRFMNSLVFKKTVISQNFDVIRTNPEASAPGSARAVQVTPHSRDFPVIVLGGDDSQKAYYLVRQKNGTYSQTQFHDCKGTVGAVLTKDLDGDGWAEVIVPCYSKNSLEIYSFKQ